MVPQNHSKVTLQTKDSGGPIKDITPPTKGPVTPVSKGMAPSKGTITPSSRGGGSGPSSRAGTPSRVLPSTSGLPVKSSSGAAAGPAKSKGGMQSRQPSVEPAAALTNLEIREDQESPASSPSARYYIFETLGIVTCKNVLL